MDSNIDKFAHIMGKHVVESLINCIYVVKYISTSLAKLKIDW